MRNQRQESIKKIRKMLMIHDLVKNITTDEEIIEADDGPSSMTGTIHIKKDFSTYIIIKTPELSYFPPMYVIDYENINKSIKYCTKYIENPKKTIFFLISFCHNFHFQKMLCKSHYLKIKNH